MDRVDRLLAIEEIKKLKARYFRSLDAKDWEMFADVFADDAVVDYRSAATDDTDVNSMPSATEELIRGRGTITQSVKDVLGDTQSVHHGHMPEIEIIDDDNASAIWAMFDILRFSPGQAVSEMVGYGHYHETYLRVDGSWKIATLKLTRLRLDNILPSRPAEGSAASGSPDVGSRA